jgi:uncharacterized alkaline shock family protein YloU
MRVTVGTIDISPVAVASIASQVVLESYGVVGMASKNIKDGLFELLAPNIGHRGVDVHAKDGQITIDLYVIIEYGIRISEVAHNIMSSVKFRVEKALGMPVAQVNVHVQGLRVSKEESRNDHTRRRRGPETGLVGSQPVAEEPCGCGQCSQRVSRT